MSYVYTIRSVTRQCSHSVYCISREMRAMFTSYTLLQIYEVIRKLRGLTHDSVCAGCIEYTQTEKLTTAHALGLQDDKYSNGAKSRKLIYFSTKYPLQS